MIRPLIPLLLGLCLVSPLAAQEPADDLPVGTRTPAELSELLGPIALYPDALIALILPAATAPLDMVMCARHLASGRPLATLQEESWDPSVKALAHYPDTLRWLDENLEWTTQLGYAFIEQPVQVMETIQELRATARELGNLVDTPEQRIVFDDSAIRIIPTQPDFIYEPRYDPQMIYVQRPTSGALLFFSIGYGVGSWLNYDWDWHHHRLYRGDWNKGWDYRRDRDSGRYINNNLTNTQEWRPDPDRHRAQSRSVRRATSHTGSSSARTPSQDLKEDVSGKRRAGVARPNPIASSPDSRRATPRDELPKIDRNGKIPASVPQQDRPSGPDKSVRANKGPGERLDQADRPPPGNSPGPTKRDRPAADPTRQESVKPQVHPEQDQKARITPPPQTRQQETRKNPAREEPAEEAAQGSRDNNNKSSGKKGGEEGKGDSQDKNKKKP